MLSTCPECLSQVEHGNSEAKVKCHSCQTTFSPFMKESDHAGGDIPQFEESTNAFKEIINFGENLQLGGETPVAAEPSLSQRPASVPSSQAPAMTSPAPDLGRLVTTGESLAGKTVETVLGTVSCTASLGDAEEPLGPGIESLWQRATALGGNALTTLRVCSLSDSQVLLFATAVRCQAN